MTDTGVNFTWSGKIAHDLKNPVGSVLLTLDLIQHLGPLNEKQTIHLERALQTLRRMNITINRLLEMADLENLALVERIPVDMLQIIQQTAIQLSVVAEQRQVRFEIESTAERNIVTGDSVLLGQLTDNLMGNAVKYNREGGIVRVKLDNDPGLLHLSVQDDGPGIGADDIPHVFEAFFRSEEMRKRKLSGSGLGLAIAKEIVERHNGRIWVDSKPGGGATFHVTLALIPQNVDDGFRDNDGRSIMGESDERAVSRHLDHVSEERDPVDDAIQEKRDMGHRDPADDQS